MKTKLGGWPLTQSPDPALEALGSMPAQQSKQTQGENVLWTENLGGAF